MSTGDRATPIFGKLESVLRSSGDLVVRQPEYAEGYPYQLTADLDIVDLVRNGDALVRQPLETIARS